MGYRQRRLNKPPTASLFARMRTDAPDGSREGKSLENRCDGIGITALRYFLDILLAIGMGGALKFARAETITLVVAQNQL